MIIRMVVVIVLITPIVIALIRKLSLLFSCRNQVVIKDVTNSKLDFYIDNSFGREIVHWIRSSSYILVEIIILI